MSAPTPTKTSRPKSHEIFRRASDVLVGGVNSPVRAFRAVGGEPVVVDHGSGAHLWDADGNEYIDYVCSWGALILGHAHPKVVDAIVAQAWRGTSYGMPTELEVELASRIRNALPSCEKVRFVSSGTEATMSAVRLARAATGRDLIVKFEGCYHGHSDSFLAEAGSGLATLGIAACPGVPQALAALTLNAPYNDDAAAVEKLFAQNQNKIAAVIVEPIAANMGLVPPSDGFLQRLRDLTTRHGALLIFDEVITGFRVCYGGAQNLFGITPDLTTLGKIIGGGLPVAAYGGRRDLMDQVAPLGPVYQAGTLSGNPLAMSAGIASLDLLAAPGFYEVLDVRAKRLGDGIAAVLRETGFPPRLRVQGRWSRFSFRASRLPIMPPQRNAIRSALPHFSAPCWTVAFFLRRRSSRRSLFRPRIPMRILTVRLPLAAKVLLRLSWYELKNGNEKLLRYIHPRRRDHA